MIPKTERRRPDGPMWIRRLSAFSLVAAACHDVPSEPPARTAPERPAEPGATAPNASVHPVGTASETPKATGATVSDDSFRYPGAARVVAIGDIHGDLAAGRRALRLAGAIDADDDWIGKELVVVQTGDEIDRGDDDRAVIDLLAGLGKKARAHGGRVHALNGNHEVMNVQGDFRYVTRGGFAAFARESTTGTTAVDRFPPEARGRAAAFSPGGSYARILGQRDSVAVVGNTVFVHGGVTADHVKYGLGRFNAEVKRWMTGGGPAPALAEDPEGPLWTRRYSDEKAGIDCEGLAAALAAVSAKRMVVGHTPHDKGIASGCDGRVWWIDCGLSAFYGGPTQVLEIAGDRVRVLGTDPDRATK